ncbi:C40 family peptidase [Streptomyces sp. NPDC014636]|uniref:C40 family peptidase n=1 Tax=Streptomyces sp. NPDC014636 TaxID=3364876 RepID=UPI0036FC150B
MASHRKPRPGGTQAAGIRTPALATAALTSVAVLSQTAEATTGTDHGRPSLEEVERKIDELYRRADSAADTSGTGRERTEHKVRTERTERNERPERTERVVLDERGERERGERAEAPRRRADSLQRLREEVARRAQHRAVPAQRATLPAQRATLPERRAAIPERRAVIPERRAAIPAQRGTVPVPDAATGARIDAAALAAPERQPETAASGPKAAKATVQKKLAHARVLLSQRTAGAPSGTDAALVAPGTDAALVAPGTDATKAGKAIAFARAQLGKPCVWGAAGPGSYDCSGLIQAAWKSAGVTLPRTARRQAGAGTPVSPADARPGDLVFFHDDAGHVGLCTGGGMMIHAPRPGAYVREEPVSAIGEAAVHSVVRPG